MNKIIFQIIPVFPTSLWEECILLTITFFLKNNMPPLPTGPEVVKIHGNTKLNMELAMSPAKSSLTH